MNFLVLVLSALFLETSFGFQETSPYNTHYTIPFFYGSRYEERNSREVILQDSPTQFFWSHTFNVDYRNNLWVADKSKSSILYLSKEQLTWNAMFKVTGREFITGMRNGNIDKATFNHPHSICVYDRNLTKIALARSIRPIYLFESALTNLTCLEWLSKENYQECGQLILSDADLEKRAAGMSDKEILASKMLEREKKM